MKLDLQIKLQAKKKAFTLPEIIVSISVIVLVITAATGILVSVIRSNNDNLSTLVAYGLAQEGLEAFRNVRDSNWILGLEFDGKKPGQQANQDFIWGDSLFDKNEPENTQKFFVLHRKNNSELEACTDQQVSDCAPWQIVTIQNPNSQVVDQNGKIILSPFPFSELDKMQIYKISSDSNNPEQTDVSLYNQFSNPNIIQNIDKTSFSRLIAVEKVCFSKTKGPDCNAQENENLKLRVSSIVVWTSATNGLNKQVVLTTELTDWKK